MLLFLLFCCFACVHAYRENTWPLLLFRQVVFITALQRSANGRGNAFCKWVSQDGTIPTIPCFFMWSHGWMSSVFKPVGIAPILLAVKKNSRDVYPFCISTNFPAHIGVCYSGVWVYTVRAKVQSLKVIPCQDPLHIEEYRWCGNYFTLVEKYFEPRTQCTWATDL